MAQQKHPKGLYVLFATEMWERFNYYGMRALLVLYLTASLTAGGFQLNRSQALEIYAIFSGLVYLTPIIGGILADKILGQRQAIYIGGILMALGQFTLALSQTMPTTYRQFIFNSGLGIIILGNGFFKPNISTLVGKLYPDDDARKDAAFTIFYMGINLGAFIAPLICGYIASQFGWSWGFSCAGIGMIVGVIWFITQEKYVENSELSANIPASTLSYTNRHITSWTRVMLFTVSSIAFVWGVLWSVNHLSITIQHYTLSILIPIGVFAVAYLIFKNTNGMAEWKKSGVILLLMLFNMVFWAGFEQAGGTFNLFAQQHTNRLIGNWEIPASWFQAINAIGIIALAPIISSLWIWLTHRNKNPSIPIKFSFGLILLGLGFIIMQIAKNTSIDTPLVSPLWLVSVYTIHTVAELCLSPIGLSMVSKLAPKKITSVMMGLWFISIAMGNYFAGILENLLHHHLQKVELFYFLAITSIFAGIVLGILAPFLHRIIKD